MTDRALSMIGIAMKAGKLCSGEFAVSEAVKRGRAYLVIIARDASPASRKSYHDMCRYYKVPALEYGSRDSLGRSCGKEFRASLAVTDEGLAKAIRKLIEKGI